MASDYVSAARTPLRRRVFFAVFRRFAALHMAPHSSTRLYEGRETQVIDFAYASARLRP